MRLHCLRILIALLTFAAGVAASSLLNFKRTTPCMRSVEARLLSASAPATLPEPVVVEAPQSRPLLAGRPYKDDYGVINSGVLNGMALSKPEPAYPPAAKAARASGAV